MNDVIFIEDLKVRCIIGIFDWERKIKQTVSLNLRFPTDIRKAAHKDSIEKALDYKKIAKFTIAFVSKSRYFLIETLAERLSQSLLKQFRLSWVELRVAKPGALRGAKNVGIEIRRKRSS